MECRARLEIVAAGARLTEYGVIRPNEGNISVRLSGGDLLMTPTAMDKGRLDPSDCVLVGRDSAAPPQASSEVKVHRAVLAAFPDVCAVVHAHPPNVLRVARAERRPREDLVAEGEALLGSIAWLPAQDPGSSRLAAAVAAGLEGQGVVVVDRHGAFTVGTNVGEAVRRMLVLEHLAEVSLGSS